MAFPRGVLIVVSIAATAVSIPTVAVFDQYPMVAVGSASHIRKVFCRNRVLRELALHNGSRLAHRQGLGPKDVSAFGIRILHCKQVCSGQPTNHEAVSVVVSEPNVTNRFIPSYITHIDKSPSYSNQAYTTPAVRVQTTPPMASYAMAMAIAHTQ
jgi:hypothetical protein